MNLSEHSLQEPTLVNYSNSPVSAVSVACGQPQFKNMKWKILKINNSCFKLHTILSDEIMHPPALSAQVGNYPFVQLILAIYPTHSSV